VVEEYSMKSFGGVYVVAMVGKYLVAGDVVLMVFLDR